MWAARGITIFLAAVCIAVAPSPAAAQVVTITSVNKTSVRPFQLLTITGTGFQPQTSELAVVVAPAGTTNSIATTIPVYGASATWVEFLVPPLVDASSGAFIGGTVGLQVIQTTATSVMSSNVLGGVTISRLLDLSQSIKAGSVTRGFLQSGMNVLSVVQGDTANPSLAALIASLRTEGAALVSPIQRVENNSRLELSLPTTDGLPFSLDSRTLGIADRLIAAYLEETVPLLEAAEPPVSLAAEARRATDCSLYTSNPVTDDFLCRNQRLHQLKAEKAAETWQWGAKLYAGTAGSLMGGWSIGLLARSQVIAAATADALQLLWTAAVPYLTSYLTLSPAPPVYKPIRSVGVSVLDKKVAAGLPILSGTLSAVEIYSSASELVDANRDAVEKGLILSSSDPGGGNRGVETYKPATGCATTPCVAVHSLSVPPSQTVTTLAAATVPAPTVSKFNGTYTGTYNGWWAGDGESLAVSGSVLFAVSNGTMTVTGPGPGVGTVSAQGRVLTGSIAVDGASCTFGGGFAVTPQTNRGLANGGFFCTLPDGSTSAGDWSAVR